MAHHNPAHPRTRAMKPQRGTTNVRIQLLPSSRPPRTKSAPTATSTSPPPPSAAISINSSPRKSLMAFTMSMKSVACAVALQDAQLEAQRETAPPVTVMTRAPLAKVPHLHPSLPSRISRQTISTVCRQEASTTASIGSIGRLRASSTIPVPSTHLSPSSPPHPDLSPVPLWGPSERFPCIHKT